MNASVKEALIRAAIDVRENSYAPYSGFRVGAALLTLNGCIFTGCNVENVAYGLTVCAEQNAICKAISEGDNEFLAMAIAADTNEPVMPCGACRQIMGEFNPELDLVLVNLKGKIIESSLSILLPSLFKMD
ncbi:cytidine deaminase [bacterium]|nr:cytidine deaminase [bacterium]